MKITIVVLSFILYNTIGIICGESIDLYSYFMGAGLLYGIGWMRGDSKE